ncbi:MAG: multidrug transporter [Lachnospiraceae bacterium]|nr:multidrug transporter [Lachnospiraceae bacterium]MDD3616602.1 multidrug transporter [Lachnospiraceae bacterium]
MQEQKFTKQDWKLFRNKIADWQESYMDKLTKEYIELMNSDAKPSEKFWDLDKRIKEDKRRKGVLLNMSRSDLIYNIVSLINEGAIDFGDLEDFSDELKESVSIFFKR